MPAPSEGMRGCYSVLGPSVSHAECRSWVIFHRRRKHLTTVGLPPVPESPTNSTWIGSLFPDSVRGSWVPTTWEEGQVLT